MEYAQFDEYESSWATPPAQFSMVKFLPALC